MADSACLLGFFDWGNARQLVLYGVSYFSPPARVTMLMVVISIS
jgi:hypothetical protein